MADSGEYYRLVVRDEDGQINTHDWGDGLLVHVLPGVSEGRDVADVANDYGALLMAIHRQERRVVDKQELVGGGTKTVVESDKSSVTGPIGYASALMVTSVVRIGHPLSHFEIK